MAWVKIKNTYGDVVEIPEPVYENMFKSNKAYSIVEGPKPIPEKINKVEEIVDNEQIQQLKSNESNTTRKGSKKVI